MNSIFLPETPKEQKRDELKLVNTVSNEFKGKNLSLTEEKNLLIKMQNAETEIFEEQLDYMKSENRLLPNYFLKETPIRKKCDRDHLFLEFNKLLTTPKKYFGEDILSTVPKNMGRFVNSVDRSKINKQSNKTCMYTPQKSKTRSSTTNAKPLLCDYQCKYCKQEFQSLQIPIKPTNKSFKKWPISFFKIIYDFLIYQVPLILISYSFALYLLSCL